MSAPCDVLSKVLGKNLKYLYDGEPSCDVKISSKKSGYRVEFTNCQSDGFEYGVTFMPYEVSFAGKKACLLKGEEHSRYILLRQIDDHSSRIDMGTSWDKNAIREIKKSDQEAPTTLRY